MYLKSVTSTLALAAVLGLAALAPESANAQNASPAAYTIPAKPIFYRTVKVDGLDVFYREAGPKDAPVILLLHGFPSSSHQFRNLIPLLADKFRVIAPDYPGFGRTTQPDRSAFAYTFDNLYAVVDKFTRAVGAEKFAVYIQDYGSPVGLRFALHQPERVTALIVQNGNAYEVGLSPLWAPIQALWAKDTPETRAGAASFLKRETTSFQYSEGVPADRVNPDAIDNDQAILDRPGNRDIQLDLFANYQSNVVLYPAFHEAFRKRQFPTLVVWGAKDPIFTVAGAEAFKKDLPKAEIHLLEAGHFATETHGDAIAGLIREFLPRALKTSRS